jgi:16S rRNA (cytidine1402-2'-O)-methyltransferase
VKHDSSQTLPTGNPSPPQTQTGGYPPGLYIVATPIGNLKDITLRALEVLGMADLIVCEDTRVSGKLLSHYGIHKPTLSYNDHNAADRRPKIFSALEEGQRVALISDAGTPLVSDPGFKLASEAHARGIYVTTLPGPSSTLAALCLSGLPTDRFFFAGFLPPRKEACRKDLQALMAIPATLVFFESARRLIDTLSLMREVLGDRKAAVVREITKLYEESRRASLSELVRQYERDGEPRGEVVIVVGGPQDAPIPEEVIAAKLKLLLASHSVKEAASIMAEETGQPRKEIYTLALRLMQDE